MIINFFIFINFFSQVHLTKLYWWQVAPAMRIYQRKPDKYDMIMIVRVSKFAIPRFIQLI